MDCDQSRRVEDTFKDLISNLPLDLKEKILVNLPVKEAVRTSILSKDWTDAWKSILDLVLRDKDFVSQNPDTAEVNRFIEFVYRFLSLHSGPILKFVLSSKLDLRKKVFHRWIGVLSGKGIQRLIVKGSYDDGRIYKMPINLFSCHTLKCLRLVSCTVKVPKRFEGFKQLRSLYLEWCTVSDNDFGKLVSSCPMLVTLRLYTDVHFENLNICSPSLLNLFYYGKFRNIHINAPHLEMACVRTRRPTNNTSSSRPVKNFACLYDVKRLNLNYAFLKYLGSGPDSKRFPTSFSNLKEIMMDLNLGDHQHATLFLCLFQNAPQLRNLRILKIHTKKSSTIPPTGNFWQSAITQGTPFNQLRAVKFDKFVSSESVLSFVRFVLATAPVLRHLIIYKDDSPMILEKLLKFEKISKEAQIHVY